MLTEWLVSACRIELQGHCALFMRSLVFVHQMLCSSLIDSLDGSLISSLRGSLIAAGNSSVKFFQGSFQRAYIRTFEAGITYPRLSEACYLAKDDLELLIYLINPSVCLLLWKCKWYENVHIERSKIFPL